MHSFQCQAAAGACIGSPGAYSAALGGSLLGGFCLMSCTSGDTHVGFYPFAFSALRTRCSRPLLTKRRACATFCVGLEIVCLLFFLFLFLVFELSRLRWSSLLFVHPRIRFPLIIPGFTQNMIALWGISVKCHPDIFYSCQMLYDKGNKIASLVSDESAVDQAFQ